MPNECRLVSVRVDLCLCVVGMNFFKVVPDEVLQKIFEMSDFRGQCRMYDLSKDLFGRLEKLNCIVFIPSVDFVASLFWKMDLDAPPRFRLGDVDALTEINCFRYNRELVSRFLARCTDEELFEKLPCHPRVYLTLLIEQFDFETVSRFLDQDEIDTPDGITKHFYRAVNSDALEYEEIFNEYIDPALKGESTEDPSLAAMLGYFWKGDLDGFKRCLNAGIGIPKWLFQRPGWEHLTVDRENQGGLAKIYELMMAKSKETLADGHFIYAAVKGLDEVLKVITKKAKTSFINRGIPKPSLSTLYRALACGIQANQFEVAQLLWSLIEENSERWNASHEYLRCLFLARNSTNLYDLLLSNVPFALTNLCKKVEQGGRGSIKKIIENYPETINEVKLAYYLDHHWMDVPLLRFTLNSEEKMTEIWDALSISPTEHHIFSLKITQLMIPLSLF